jgi:hypothetical protein
MHSRSLGCALALVAMCANMSFARAARGDTFTTIATVGFNTTSKETVAAIASDASGNVYVVGTSEAFSQAVPNDLPGADSRDLAGKDVFIAKIMGSTGEVRWIVRTGTKLEDEGQDVAVDPPGENLYVVGRTNGQFGSAPRKGQYDVFVVKYNIAGPGRPVRDWGGPLMIGTSSADDASKVALDATGSFIYVIGYTRGNLFRPAGSGDRPSDFDAFITRLRASDGSTDASQQFGTDDDDLAKHLSLPKDAAGPILVGVETIRVVGNVEVKNMNVFKFRGSDLAPLGSVLVKTFSRETVAGVARHPFFPATLFAGGSSWLRQADGWDFTVKRLAQPVDDDGDLGRVVVDVSEVASPEYSRRQGSAGGQDDKAVAMQLDPVSGRLWMAGSTSGHMAAGVPRRSSSQIVFAAIDPDTGAAAHTAQEALETEASFASVAGFVFSANSSAITYAATRLDVPTGDLYTVVGEYSILPELRVSIPTPEPAPSPAESPSGAGSQDREVTTTHGADLPVVAIGGGIAGVVLIAIIIVALCAIRRVRSRSQALKHGQGQPGHGRRQRENVQRPPPVARPRPRSPPRPTGGGAANATGLY